MLLLIIIILVKGNSSKICQVVVKWFQFVNCTRLPSSVYRGQQPSLALYVGCFLAALPAFCTNVCMYVIWCWARGVRYPPPISGERFRYDRRGRGGCVDRDVIRILTGGIRSVILRSIGRFRSLNS